MIRKITALLTAALLLAGCGEPEDTFSHQSRCEKIRIVSMAPNVTEILYKLGLSNQVAGVSNYSNYPPEAKDKPHVGGTYDPNWEMIVSLQPNRVIGLETQEEIAARLRSLNMDFLGVPHERIDEIMQSILIIGEACGAKERAQEIFQTLEATALRHRNFSKDWKPKVLVCVGHDEQLTRMYIAARGTFYDDLINLAGGTNACGQTAIKYPETSPEGLHAMKPDLIIDLVPNKGVQAPAVAKAMADKQPASNAWKHPNVVTLTNDYSFIPGPRFGLLLEDFLQAIGQNDLKAE